VAAGLQKWPQVFNLPEHNASNRLVQVENLHPLQTAAAMRDCRSQKWPQVFNLREHNASNRLVQVENLHPLRTAAAMRGRRSSKVAAGF
jgi:hypothetical protein